ncbi:site-specific integrase [Flavobacteriaceae bacterium]|jgi:integrase|nr:site-specific integrase [Flavobacteriaceae bacterium]MDB4255125.1 site-specific integrase [Flavobacteriaceae bacterium]
MRDYNDKIVANGIDQGVLLTQISNYIKHAPLRRLKRSGSLGLSNNSIRNLKRFYDLIQEFESDFGQSIMLDTIDHMLVNAFKEWLLTKKEYSLNNAGLQLKLLKMICKEAERMSINVNPYTRHIESFTQKSKDRVLQTISFEEIKKIKAIRNLPSTLENARKWMLIGLYVGQRVSDLLALKPLQLRFIENGVYIDINQQKTDKYVTVGVVDKEVIQILKQRFPYPISAQLFNRQIKQICQIAGIYEMVSGYKLCIKTKRKRLGIHPKYSLISSHDLRRSFATNYFGKIETPILMQITGHSKESTFLSYIGSQVNKDTYADAFMKVAATL